MANTYHCLIYHLVFSTKNREALIAPGFERRLWLYLGGIISNHGLVPIEIGGIEDHIHILLTGSPTMVMSKVVNTIKSNSSRWVNERRIIPEMFQWQDGYGLFSVSHRNMIHARDYIRHQREHHKKYSFAKEYQDLVEQHGINFDERYLLG